MILTRFCSRQEFDKFLAGETLINNTDHYRGGKGGSVSKGFCFSPDEPKTAWRYLKGIVSYDACIIVDIPDDTPMLRKSCGKYMDYSNSRPFPHVCVKPEYCITEYDRNTAKLVRALPPEEFAAKEELRVLEVLRFIKS